MRKKDETVKEKINIAVIGLGGRGYGLLELVLYRMQDVEVVAVCDTYPERVENAKKLAVRMKRNEPKGYTDYKEIITNENIKAVVISTSWAAHTPIAMAFMEAGISVGAEVGGAYDIDECWKLVKCYEKTGTPYMMLENCCYGDYELATLQMHRQGDMGVIVHCDGAYAHDIRDEIAFGKSQKHYRLNEYINRNCENYPTHEIGPIAKLLNITFGNKFDYLVSMASPAKGLHQYVTTRKDKYPELAYLKDTVFQQSDIVSTLIKCHNGETISIKLDTTLPRAYSRGYQVHGTKAFYSEDLDSLYIDSKNNKNKVHKKPTSYLTKKYCHPIWEWFKKNGVRGGHGGMDWLVLAAFIEAVRKGDGKMPIDVYEAVTWMVITALSEQSIKNNSQAVEFPDFTNGEWRTRTQDGEGLFFIK